MAKLKWGTVGEKTFESGVDRGVLYVGENPGVAWNGLTGVSETPTGGDPQPYYVDGYKYLNMASTEEFSATIEAYSAPPEFNECDGTVSIHNGLFATRQPRKPFSLTYRTRIGNDIDGFDHGYKIHIVYNALADPSDRSYVTIGGSVDPMRLSWDISTQPPYTTSMRPTSHLIIDSTKTNKILLGYLESILYGGNGFEPRLLDPDAIAAIFDWDFPEFNLPINIIGEGGNEKVEFVNEATNPSFETASGTVEVRRNLAVNPVAAVNGMGWSQTPGAGGTSSGSRVTDLVGHPLGFTTGYANTWSVAPTAGGPSIRYGRPNQLDLPVTEGDTPYIHMFVSPSWDTPIGLLVTYFDDSATGLGSSAILPVVDQPVTPANVWRHLEGQADAAPAGATRMNVIAQAGTMPGVGDKLVGSGAYVGAPGPYFDGDTLPRVRENYVRNPDVVGGVWWNVSGGSGGSATGSVIEVDDLPDGITHGYRSTWSVAPSGGTIGVYYGRVTFTDLAVAPGDPFAFFAYGRASWDVGIGLRVGFYDEAGATVENYVPYTPGSETPTPAGEWKYMEGTHVVPAGAVRVRIWVLTASNVPPQPGDSVDIAGVYASDRPGTWLTGFVGAPQGYATAWTGDPDASVSYIYDDDFSVSWTGTENASESVLTGDAVDGVFGTPQACVPVRSSHWSAVGEYSMRLIPTEPHNASFVDFSVPLGARDWSEGTLLATRYIEAPLTGSLHGNAGRINIFATTGISMGNLPNEAGEGLARTTWEGPVTGSARIRVFHGGSAGSGDVWWDGLIIIEGEYDGDYFDGNTRPIYKNQRAVTEWSGTENASVSRMNYYTLLESPGSVGDAYIIDNSIWVFTEEGYWDQVFEIPE